MSKKDWTSFIKSAAKSAGFDECGISRAEALVEDKVELDTFIRQGRHDELHYLEKNTNVRTDPRLVVENARSVISLLVYYHPGKPAWKKGDYKISTYSLGKDYHVTIKKRLQILFEQIKEEIPGFDGRYFVDSSPMLEKAWAKRAGLGWIGKNTLLLNKKYGSQVFIGDIICNTELEYDEPLEDACGNCNKCVSACPTGALFVPYKIDAGKCIAYLTTEYRGDVIPENKAKRLNNWMYGCDICQNVCPYNQELPLTRKKEFLPNPSLMAMTPEKWNQLKPGEFQELFKETAVKRLKYKGLKRNIQAINITV